MASLAIARQTVLTPHRILQLLRAAIVFAVLGLLVLTLGPFEGLEARFGLSDGLAHAVAFYGLTLLAFAVAPRTRRTDLAVWVLAFGLVIELAQGLVGRSLSLMDLLADAAGVGVATVPALIERFRDAARRRPYLTFAAIRERDRRGRSRGSQGFAPRNRSADDASGEAWR